MSLTTKTAIDLPNDDLGPDDGPLGLRDLIREDWARHGREIGSAGMHALVLHRIGHEALRRDGLGWTVVRKVYNKVNRLWIRNVYGVELPPEATIGRRVYIPHAFGIAIDEQAVVGDDCLVRHRVTLGRTADASGAPRLGRNVSLGAGAVVAGDVYVGDDVVIGPNAVVLSDVPDGATAFGPPARILRPQPRSERRAE